MAGKILTMGYAIFYVPLFLYTMNILFQANYQRIKAVDDMLEQELHHVEADVNEIITETLPKKRTRRRIAKI